MPGPMNRPPRGMKPTVDNPGRIFKRLIAYIFKDFGWHFAFVFLMIVINVLSSIQGTMFTKRLIDDYITPYLLNTDAPDYGPLLHAMGRVAIFYGLGIIAAFIQNKTK